MNLIWVDGGHGGREQLFRQSIRVVDGLDARAGTTLQLWVGGAVIKQRGQEQLVVLQHRGVEASTTPADAPVEATGCIADQDCRPLGEGVEHPYPIGVLPKKASASSLVQRTS